MQQKWRLFKRSHSGVFFVNTLLWANRIGRFAVLVGLLVFLYYAYRYSLHIIIHKNFAFGIVALWALTAYITIPRIHRQLTKIYLPDYFIGRVRTADGLLGDPVNLAVIGSASELRTAMEAAGWVEAEPVRLTSTLKMIQSIIFGTSYPNAPISALFLFSQRQTYGFQKEVGGNARQRHHVRFWKTPSGWWLPGGHPADWLGSAAFDTNFGLSLFTGQFTHRIDENVDEERDFVIDSLSQTPGTTVEIVTHFSTGFHARNGGGDHMHTDGAMPFVHLRKP